MQNRDILGRTENLPRRSLRNLDSSLPLNININLNESDTSSSDSTYSSNSSAFDDSSTSSTMVSDTTETFATNPFSANINPASTNGLKLYQAATATRSETQLLKTTITEAKTFLDAMKDDATKFAWGKLTALITDGDEHRNILRDFRHLTVNKVRLSMNNIFHSRTTTTLPVGRNPVMFSIDPANNDDDKVIFYKRVRANLIGLRIIGSLTATSLASLKLKESIYLWISDTGEEFYDGPTMLQICVEKVNPNTRVGVAHLKENLRNSKLANYDNNVRDMTDKMSSIHDEIVQRGFTHDDFILDLYQALLSGKNEIFTSYIQRKRDDWDAGDDISADNLIKDAITKYNNMVIRKDWKQEEAKNSKIVALTTQVKELQDKLKSSNNSSKDSSKSSGKTNHFNIEEWRLTKSLGNTTEKDGKTWHWCSKQHNNGKGMYVTHKEEDHLGWQEWKNQRKNGRQSKPSSNDSESIHKKEGTNKNMALSDNLKAAMMSKFKCSTSDAEKLWTDVVKQSN
jgi:hypothetical protein